MPGNMQRQLTKEASSDLDSEADLLYAQDMQAAAAEAEIELFDEPEPIIRTFKRMTTTTMPKGGMWDLMSYDEKVRAGPSSLFPLLHLVPTPPGSDASLSASHVGLDCRSRCFTSSQRCLLKNRWGLCKGGSDVLTIATCCPSAQTEKLRENDF